MELTALDKRDTLREALFLWYTPLVAALSISVVAASSAAWAAALSPAATAASTFLIAVLTLDLIALFLAALVSFTKILFFADLMLAHEIRLRSSYYNLCVFDQSLDTDSSM